MTARPDGSILAMFLLACLVGGANFVGIRFSNQELPPLWGAALRFLPAALLFFAVLTLRGVSVPRGRALQGGFVYGALSVFGFYAFAYLGLVRATSGMAAVVLAVVPLATFLLAWAHGVERFSWQKVAGGALALSGIFVLIGSQAIAGTRADALAVVFLVLAVLCVAEAAVLLKRFPGTDPVATNAVGLGVGGLLFLAASGALHLLGVGHEDVVWPTLRTTWITLAYLVLVGTFLLFFLYVSLIQRWTASSTTYMFLAFPLVASLLGALLLDEPVTRSLMVSGLLVIIGVYVGAIRPAASEPSPEAASA